MPDFFIIAAYPNEDVVELTLNSKGIAEAACTDNAEQRMINNFIKNCCKLSSLR